MAARGQLVGFGGAVAESDLLYLAGEPRQAFAVLETHLATDSTDYDALWRAVRASVVIGLEEEGNTAQNLWFDPAIHLAHRAVALRPDGVDALYWRGVVTGRRAMNAKPSYAVDLVQFVYDDAHTILSRIERAVARVFMGNAALGDASWENARYHLEKSVESWPDLVLLQFDLGQLYRKRGSREAAVQAFRKVLDLPAAHPIDPRLQDEARELLAELSG
jgi:tetratricopeptide (TPR) repeat protein